MARQHFTLAEGNKDLFGFLGFQNERIGPKDLKKEAERKNREEMADSDLLHFSDDEDSHVAEDTKKVAHAPEQETPEPLLSEPLLTPLLSDFCESVISLF